MSLCYKAFSGIKDSVFSKMTCFPPRVLPRRAWNLERLRVILMFVSFVLCPWTSHQCAEFSTRFLGRADCRAGSHNTTTPNSCYSCKNGSDPLCLQELITQIPSCASSAVLHPISSSYSQCWPRKQTNKHFFFLESEHFPTLYSDCGTTVCPFLWQSVIKRNFTEKPEDLLVLKQQQLDLVKLCTSIL